MKTLFLFLFLIISGLITSCTDSKVSCAKSCQQQAKPKMQECFHMKDKPMEMSKCTTRVSVELNECVQKCN